MISMLSRQVVGLFVVIGLCLVLPFFIGAGWTSLVIEIFIMSIAASAANFMTGYAGMVSFGVAGFYGAGAYVTALMVVKLQAPFLLAFVSGPVVVAIIALFVGWFCVRRTAVYFSMLTLAFSQLMYTVAYTWYGFTGGDDGIVGINLPDWLGSTFAYYYFSFVVLCLCLFIMWRIVNSPLGKTFQALRENPERTKFIGINVRLYQHTAFVIGNFFLATAGSLYCGFNQNVFPDSMFWAKTFEITIIYLLGGLYTFLGPTFGALIYILANKMITRHTEYWPFALGSMIVAITLFMPRGLGGLISKVLGKAAGEREAEK